MSIDQQQPPAAAPKQKNWFARHKVITGFAALFLVAGIGSAAGSSGGTDTAAQKDSPTTSSSSPKTEAKTKTPAKQTPAKTETKPATTTNEAPAAAAGGPSASFPKIDGDWRLDSLTVTKQDFTGSFEGRARITYIGDDSDGGDNAFTITVFRGSKDVGALTGFANTVMPGQTKTVDLLSSDSYVSGAKTYDFQNDW